MGKELDCLRALEAESSRNGAQTHNHSVTNTMTLNALEKEYRMNRGLYELLCKEIATQVGELLSVERISVASPFEYRVKTWSSLAEKIERNRSEPKNLSEIGDVAGIRIIALFRRDVERISKIVESHLDVLAKEDTSSRLAEDQFGYGSIHYEVRPPAEWLKIPTLRKLEGLRAEIQVRTGSQHIWAAASQVLQYKKETHVPIPLRRSINRAAALLETVDLEFERFLLEREQYTKEIRTEAEDLPLNTESLRQVLDEIFPAQNRAQDEDYATLLDDLTQSKITTTDQLKALVAKHLKAVMEGEHSYVTRRTADLASGTPVVGTTAERVRSGVYFTHVGLAREALRREFGPDISFPRTKKK